MARVRPHPALHLGEQEQASQTGCMRCLYAKVTFNTRTGNCVMQLPAHDKHVGKTGLPFGGWLRPGRTSGSRVEVATLQSHNTLYQSLCALHLVRCDW